MAGLVTGLVILYEIEDIILKDGDVWLEFWVGDVEDLAEVLIDDGEVFSKENEPVLLIGKLVGDEKTKDPEVEARDDEEAEDREFGSGVEVVE